MPQDDDRIQKYLLAAVRSCCHGGRGRQSYELESWQGHGSACYRRIRRFEQMVSVFFKAGPEGFLVHSALRSLLLPLHLRWRYRLTWQQEKELQQHVDAFVTHCGEYFSDTPEDLFNFFVDPKLLVMPFHFRQAVSGWSRA